MRLRTTATAVRLGTRAEGALHEARAYRCAKVVDEKSIPNHVACSKTETRGRNAYAAESGFPRSLLAPGLTKQIFSSEISTSWGPTAHHFFSRAVSLVLWNVVPCPPSQAVSHK